MDWRKIRAEYEASSITLKALAEKHNVKLGTLKSRKSREKWTRVARKKDATKKKKDASSKLIIETTDLNDRQKMFCLYYLKYYNATKAYQKAYDCSYSVANKNAYTLMVNQGVKVEIKRLKAERQSGVFLDGQAVLQKYIDIAFADITDFVNFGTKEVGPNKTLVDYVDVKNSNGIDGTLLTEVKQGKEGITVKLADKMKALEKLERFFDLLPDEHKRKIEEEKTIIAKQKHELDERVVKLREQESIKKDW